MSKMSKRPKKTGGLHSKKIPSQTPAYPSSQSPLQVRQSLYEGPLPLPAHLEEYDRIVPGAAERIIAMAERQATHRQNLEKKAIDSGSRDSLLGLIFGLIIGVSAICSGTYGIYKGVETGGISIIIITIASLVGVFVYGSRQRRKERETKWK